MHCQLINIKALIAYIQSLQLIINILREWFVLSFNEFIDRLKFQSVQKCAANDFNRNTLTYTLPCVKYTYGKYCKVHAYLLRISCEMYHFVNDPRIKDVPIAIKAEAELNSRIQFCQRFSIKSDYNHEKWHQKLRSDIYTQSFSNANQEASSKQMFLQKVLHDPITDSIDSLNQSMAYLSLHPSDKCMQNLQKNNVIDDWNDYDSITNQNVNVNVNQCDKLRKNRFLFDFYFDKSKIADASVKPLNLIEFSREKKEDDDW